MILRMHLTALRGMRKPILERLPELLGSHFWSFIFSASTLGILIFIFWGCRQILSSDKCSHAEAICCFLDSLALEHQQESWVSSRIGHFQEDQGFLALSDKNRGS